MIEVSRAPMLDPVAIADLRPTQMTVGLREVEEKRKAWKGKSASAREKFFGRHVIPVVLGPKKRNYVIDHHHLARALQEEDVTHVLVTVISDLSKLEKDAFWFVMDCRHWAFPYDGQGHRRPFDDMPKSIAALTDDPYRSLAGALRQAGGFAKDTTPFSEFLWADFLRRTLDPGLVKKDFDGALAAALKLAASDDADYLPGWCGPAGSRT